MLEVEETVREDTDRYYKHSYTVNQDGVCIALSTDNPEIREVLDLDMLEKKSTKLKYYITPELLDKLRTYGGNYYICKCDLEIDITYREGSLLVIVLEGFGIEVYPDGDIKKIYKKMKKIWRILDEINKRSNR